MGSERRPNATLRGDSGTGVAARRSGCAGRAWETQHEPKPIGEFIRQYRKEAGERSRGGKGRGVSPCTLAGKANPGVSLSLAAVPMKYQSGRIECLTCIMLKLVKQNDFGVEM